MTAATAFPRRHPALAVVFRDACTCARDGRRDTQCPVPAHRIPNDDEDQR